MTAPLATRWLARALRGTHLFDRAYRWFVGARSRLVLSHASPAFYDAYNEVCYSSQRAYQAAGDGVRTGLFPWEEGVIRRHFPPPPARILVGAAGGGREAFALADRGHQVVAFEPAAALARSMARNAAARGSIQVLTGRYEDLPNLVPVQPESPPLDVATLGPFDAVMLGWASFSHLRSDQQCVATLAHAARLTTGPVFVSYFSRIAGRGGSEHAAEFSIDLGYYRPMDEGQVAALAADAGLHVVDEDHYSGWSVLVRR